MIYLTGVSTELSRNAQRSDLGLLATPASSVYRQREHYDHWAADNGLFVAPLPTGEGWEDEVLGSPAYTPTAREVRYESEPKLVTRWLAWLSQMDPARCLFATLPDVVGDYAATWERSAMYVERVRGLGFRPAFVLQDGVENDRYVWGSILNACEDGTGAVFLGGSTEWKLSEAAAGLVAEAKARGIWVHMGRVNSYKRLSYAASIGCDSADGTYLGYGPVKNWPSLVSWLDRLNQPQLALAA